MKVRVGVGLYGWPFPKVDAAYLWEFIDRSEALGIDSIWLADRIVSTSVTLESMTFMAALAARTKKMKFGNSVLALPLRNPAVLAKEIATIDFLSGGRMLPAVGLGTDNPAEFQACGVDIKQRAGRTDESIVLMRRLWTEDHVTFHGKYYHTEDVTIRPRPQQQPPPIWIGGRTDAACRRVGRMGDGWLTSQLVPKELKQGIESIRAYAQAAGRTVPEDHYGTIIPYCLADTREKAMEIARPFMLRTRPEIPMEACAALGTPDDVARLLREFIAAGATKFVLRATCPADMTMAQNERLAKDVIPIFHN